MFKNFIRSVKVSAVLLGLLFGASQAAQAGYWESGLMINQVYVSGAGDVEIEFSSWKGTTCSSINGCFNAGSVVYISKDLPGKRDMLSVAHIAMASGKTVGVFVESGAPNPAHNQFNHYITGISLK